jgi:hypothetical protein
MISPCHNLELEHTGALKWLAEKEFTLSKETSHLGYIEKP